MRTQVGGIMTIDQVPVAAFESCKVLQRQRCKNLKRHE
jgi:hypothetical protein